MQLFVNGESQVAMSDNKIEITSVKEQGILTVKTFFQDLQVRNQNSDRKLVITEKDFNHIGNVLANFETNCPEECGNWIEKIKDNCSQFAQLKKLEEQNEKELEEANKGWKETNDAISSTKTEIENLSEKVKTKFEEFKKVNSVLEAKLTNLQTKFDETSVGVKDFVKPESIAKISIIASAGFVGLISIAAAYNVPSVAAQCLMLANASSVGGCVDTVYSAVPSVLFLGIPAIGAKMFKDLLNTLDGLEKNKIELVNAKSKNFTTYEEETKKLNEKKDATLQDLGTIEKNSKKFQEISEKAQEKQKTVQQIKDNAMAEVMGDIAVRTLELLRSNETLSIKYPNDLDIQKEGYLNLQNLFDAMMSSYILKAEGLKLALEKSADDQLKIEEVKVEEI